MYVTWETSLTRLKLPVIVLCDLPFKIYPVRRAVKRLFSSGVCDIGRFVLHECDVALIVAAGR